MIAALRGTLVRVEDSGVLLDVGGVGYLVFCHLRALAALHECRGDEVLLHVHTSVTDDAIRLYGFRTVEELRLFGRLIGVERIGPRAALAMLGRAELPVLVRAVRDGDVGLVSSVPGIGRKTAERIILELRDKLDDLAGLGRDAATDGDAVADAAVTGLLGLGFREPQARAAVRAAKDADGKGDLSTLVAGALRHLDREAAS